MYVASITCIIHTQPNSNDDVNSTDHVYGEAPEVHVPTQIHLLNESCKSESAEYTRDISGLPKHTDMISPHQSNSHTDEDDDRAEEVCKKEESCDEDAGQGDPEVPQQLPCDHLVRLPAAVLLQVLDSGEL